MSANLLVIQALNGVQFGVLLFLIAAGLTLVFGVMDFVNLAHGVQYMLGAYFAVMFYGMTGSFLAALVLALVASLAVGLVLEFAVFRHLYDRDHLDQVVATFGIILFLNQGVKIVWGAAPLSLPIPDLLSGTVVLMPGLALSGVASRHHRVRARHRGAALRPDPLHARRHAGARGRHQSAMVSALGVDIRRLFMIVFGFGTMLAGFAGVMIAPILSVEPGMGDTIAHPRLRRHRHRRHRLDPRRVSRRACWSGSSTRSAGRSRSTSCACSWRRRRPARSGPAIASMLIYLLMAVVLYLRPSGLFPARGR